VINASISNGSLSISLTSNDFQLKPIDSGYQICGAGHTFTVLSTKVRYGTNVMLIKTFRGASAILHNREIHDTTHLSKLLAQELHNAKQWHAGAQILLNGLP
jgi:hypothetical protein